MAVDVRLTRQSGEAWGFELVGGAQDEMSLRVAKVHEDSPAGRAGLLDGDTILNINGAEAIDLSLVTATKTVAECGDSLRIGVMRGLYDPVLDDQEPIYETFEPADLDQPSEPTEVPFKIQQFIDVPEPLNFLEPPELNPPPPFNESRSLTASPFLTSTKPYRPFSTEPIPDVPPIEDPIILNPDYNDNFGKSTEDLLNPDDLLSSYFKDAFGNIKQETRYKLPISEQYDPEGKRGKIDINVNSSLEIREESVNISVRTVEKLVEAAKICETNKENQSEVKQEIVTQKTTNKSQVTENSENVDEKTISEELKYIEKMKQEIDLDQIEQTAISVVDESIERAVSVAEEIKKEIDEETIAIYNIEQAESKIVSETDQENVKIETESKQYETMEESGEVVQKNIEAKQDHTQKSEHVAEQCETKEQVQREKYESTKRNSVVSAEQDVEQTVKSAKERKESIRLESKDAFKTVSDKSTAQDRIYSLGLQTIPNIRGVVHSSYHYDLLLKTFFIHLTDVMVALSRFILTQPVFNNQSVGSNEAMTQTVSKQGISNHTHYERNVQERRESQANQNVQQIIKPTLVKKSKQETISEKQIQQSKVEKKPAVVKPDIQKTETSDKQSLIVENHNLEVEIQEQSQNQIEATETKKVSGSKMAQLSEKKLSKELTQKMDAVVAEFETKATTDSTDITEVKKEILQRNRRSRSRSQVEEEVMRESDPLEWLAKVDSRKTSQDRVTEVSKREFNSSLLESVERNKCETTYEINQTKRAKSPKQTYVAIVEAHVYTNKDVIFEEQVSELSETSSVQSAEEVNTAFEAFEAEMTENVTLENAIKELETAKVIIEEPHEIQSGNITSEATLQAVDESEYDTKEIVKDSKAEEKSVVKQEIQKILVQERQQVVEPVVEMKKQDVEKINESLLVAQSHEIDISESKQEFTSIQQRREEAMTAVEKETKEFAAKEEMIVDNFTEIAQEHEIVESKQEAIKPEYKIIEGEEVSETVIVKEKPEKKYAVKDEFAELKIVKRIELDIESRNEIIEIEEINENGLNSDSKSDTDLVINKLELVKELEMDESQLITERSIVSAQCGTAKTVNNELIVSKQEIDEQHHDVSHDLKEVGIKQDLELSSRQIASETASQNTRYQSELVVSKTEISNKKEQSVNIEQSLDKESSLTAKSNKNLKLRTNLQVERQASVQSDENNNIDTPTPSSVPPTPLVDEYLFKLTIPLPKSRSATPVPRDCTPPYDDDHEDPDIVKKKLIPHIETTIEQVIFDPPLPSPPGSKGSSPVYTKPGLRGGSDRPQYFFINKKEEIREIERKSSLLASAIDETIKSIEEYKEEVGIETNRVVKFQETAPESIESSRNTAAQSSFEDVDVKAVDKIDTKINEFSKIYTENTSETGSNEIEASKNLNNTLSNKKSKENEANMEKETVNKIKLSEKDTVSENKPKQQENVMRSIEKEARNVHFNDQIAFKTEVMVSNEISQPKERNEISNNDTIFKSEPNVVKIESAIENQPNEEKPEGIPGFRPVGFDPEAIPKLPLQHVIVELEVPKPRLDGRQSPYMTETGEPIGTIQGIVDGLEEPVLDAEVAKELGKPGIPEEKIAELISGEAEMLREAHVMGLARVLNSHMHRVDDSSVDFEKIKPMINSLKDSEVLKALNEDLAKAKAEKKKEERKWTTFLQKPKRAVPRSKYGYHGWVQQEEMDVEEPYKVKIVKQPKPKVAPDYKPEDFETGPLPWEERQEIESSLPPVEPEEPILVPEVPEFLEAVDPLPESEVPDLEDTGIPLPPIHPKDPTPPPIRTEELVSVEPEEKETEATPESEERQEDNTGEEERTEGESKMENGLAEQLVRSVQSMVDPNATLEQQLSQMRAQLAALAQLPEVIQQTLDIVTKQLSQITHQEAREEVSVSETKTETYQKEEVSEYQSSYQESQEQNGGNQNISNGVEENGHEEVTEIAEEGQQYQNGVHDIEEEKRTEKQIKAQPNGRSRQPSAPRQGRPQPKFGPLDPDQRPQVLPGGRRWRNCEDVYNEQLYAETLHAQAELIQGKALGFESDLLPFDSSINFKKYEKPPVSLDHLQQSEVYKAVHNMDQTPLNQLELRTPVISEADYRERCRSMTPLPKQHLAIPQQFYP